MNRGSNILLNRDFVDKLRTMRKESIEVTQAVRIITDAAVSIIIRPMKHGIEMTGISQEDQWFYDHTVVDFCNEFVANIACYGLVVYAVVDGVPKVVDIRDVDITIYPHNEYEVRLRNRHSFNWDLHLVVHEHPDIATGHCGGALSRCCSEYIAGRVIWCNELAIGTNNAQSVYVISHTASEQQADMMRSVTYYNKNSFSGYNETGSALNPNGPSASDKHQAYEKIIHLSVTADDAMCRTMTDNAQKHAGADLATSHPGIQTQIRDVRAHARPTSFLPTPIGFAATQRNYVPEMRSMGPRLELISRIIFEAFGVATLRTTSAVKNTSLYHSSAEISAYNDAIRVIGALFRRFLHTPLALIVQYRMHPQLVKKAHASLTANIGDGVAVDVAVDNAVKSVVDTGITLNVTPRISQEYFTAMFNDGHVTWKSMQDYLISTGFVRQQDLEKQDPRERVNQQQHHGVKKIKPRKPIGPVPKRLKLAE